MYIPKYHLFRPYIVTCMYVCVVPFGIGQPIDVEFPGELQPPPPRLLWLPVILCVVLRPHRHFPFTWACLSVSSMFSSQLGSHVEATSWELFLTSPGGMSHSKLPISGSCGLAASSTGIFSEPWASVGVFCRVGLASTTLHFDWLWLVIFFLVPVQFKFSFKAFSSS